MTSLETATLSDSRRAERSECSRGSTCRRTGSELAEVDGAAAGGGHAKGSPRRLERRSWLRNRHSSTTRRSFSCCSKSWEAMAVGA